MTTKPTPPLGIRLRPDQRAWLESYAKCENRSLNGALGDLIDRAMKADPLTVTVAKFTVMGEAAYDVYVGPSVTNGIHIGDDKDKAIAAARAEIKRLGLPASALRFEVATPDNLNGTAISGAEFCTGETA